MVRAQPFPSSVQLGAVRVESCAEASDPVAIGGPASLIRAALESLEQWRARPARINGAPVVQPIVLQLPLR
jgi:hypothetical protein